MRSGPSVTLGWLSLNSQSPSFSAFPHSQPWFAGHVTHLPPYEMHTRYLSIHSFSGQPGTKGFEVEMLHTWNPSPWEEEAAGTWFKANLGYLVKPSHKSVNQPINSSKVWRQNDLKSPMTLGSYSNSPKLPTSWWVDDFVCFVFSGTGLLRAALTVLELICVNQADCKLRDPPGCLCLPSARTEGLCHHARLSWCLLKTQASKQIST